MLKNNLKIAFRNLWKHKLVSLTNLVGLTIGISCCLLLLLFVRYEYSFDTFSQETENIYFHYYEQKGANSRFVGLSSNEEFDDLKANYASILDAAKIRNSGYQLYPEGDLTKKMRLDSWFGTSNFFSFFDYPLIQGDKESVLSDPTSIVLTESAAQRLFGDENPIGKTVTIDESFLSKDLIVTGIAKDIKNSHVRFEAILPWDLTRKDGVKIADMWFGRSLFTYVKTPQGVNIQELTEEVNKPIIENGQIENYELFFMPFREMYMGAGNIQFLAFLSGSKSTINTLFAIAIIILLVACINYVNLQTARATGRAREVGVRKVMGAHKRQLTYQFMGESLMLTLLAAVLAVLVIDMVLPYFNQLTGKLFSMELLFAEGLLPLLVIITLITALFSGLYPAFVLSSFQPSKALKSSATVEGVRGSRLRKMLLLVQFGISMFLISITYVTYQQNQFINGKDLGFNKEQVITFNVSTRNLEPRKRIFKNELIQHPNVVAATIGTDNLGSGYTNNSGYVQLSEEPDTKAMTTIFGVDHDFVKTYSMEIVDGRDFDIDLSSDSTGVVVNEEFVKQLGLEDAIGQKVKIGTLEYTVLGVVKDFNFKALHQKVTPAMLRIAKRNHWNMSVQVQAENTRQAIEFIESKWEEFEPNENFEYSFIDERFANFYRSETRLLKAITFFSMVSIFLTALGLFGMTTFVIERRMKEIGVRKVLGASLSQINLLIIREFTAIILIAFAIAAPLAFYAGNNWLQAFAYRIDISVLPFIAAFLLSVLIITITVGGQSMKAGKKDLSEILRDE